MPVQVKSQVRVQILCVFSLCYFCAYCRRLQRTNDEVRVLTTQKIKNRISLASGNQMASYKWKGTEQQKRNTEEPYKCIKIAENI